MKNIRSLIFLSLLALFGCSADLSSITGCQSNQELNVYCGFTNPEDLALTPDKQFLIVSEFGGMAPLAEMQFGQLSLFDIDSKTKRDLPISVGDNLWGDTQCSRDHELGFGPHGIDLKQRTDGRWQLAVVSHMPVESIEMFELVQHDGWALEWRGCVKVEGQYYFNDVALTVNGDFYATHMFPKDTSMLKVIYNVFAKLDTGQVVYWSPKEGLKPLDFTRGSFPNGIALDDDSQQLVVNYNLADQTVLYNLATQQAMATYRHNSPDNVVINEGYVWVANHDHAATDTLACSKTVNCPLAFSINQLSLQDLSPIKSYTFSGSNMGVGTVGVVLNDSLWIGSYHADRLAEASIK